MNGAIHSNIQMPIWLKAWIQVLDMFSLVIFGDECWSAGGNISSKNWLQAQSYPKFSKQCRGYELGLQQLFIIRELKKICILTCDCHSNNLEVCIS